MRTIKFRAFDGKLMFYPDDNSRIVLEYNKISGWNIIPNISGYKGEYLCGESFSENEFYLMQYTGIKDKNGKEIYEGDICKYYNRIGVIKYSENCPQFVLFSGNEDFKIDKFMLKEIVVLGNIYENPELL